ncbi:GspH/FimT family pseudopilin [Pseudomonas stutzeri]|uniref:Type II secretion system protein H n=1 Tax=Stutzerimonas stutzeri TaxID=316 RepID=A0A2N8S1G3_STUST|nr:GspH/FimT family pseudopilin [Stutzerimonas stutzeri]MCQ4295627.1 GspH/FimT family pseudopilin [Stutzerimonas stutzeri]PNF80468.1 pilus assembly protein FimT [Stutzerimonas stutzeri]
MSRRRDMHGFTLIELMIVLALLAIAVGIAIPNLSRLVANNQIEAQAQTLNSLLQFARSQAVVRRTSISLSNSANDWIVANALDDTVLRQEALNPDHASVASSLSSPITLTFNANGSAEAARFVVCRDDNPAFAHLITVQPSGNTRLIRRGKDENGNDLQDCEP